MTDDPKQQARSTYMVECFWPGITQERLALACIRAHDALAHSDGHANSGQLAALLVPADEVALCLFESTSAELVRQAVEHAEIPFERIVETIHLSAPDDASTRLIDALPAHEP